MDTKYGIASLIAGIIPLLAIAWLMYGKTLFPPHVQLTQRTRDQLIAGCRWSVVAAVVLLALAVYQG